MNPQLTHQLDSIHIDQLHREAANHRLIRQAARTHHRTRLPGHRLPQLGFNPRLRERVA
jgi:hypothetical protein